MNTANKNAMSKPSLIFFIGAFTYVTQNLILLARVFICDVKHQTALSRSVSFPTPNFGPHCQTCEVVEVSHPRSNERSGNEVAYRHQLTVSVEKSTP